MDSPVLDNLCLAHHPRWIEADWYRPGWGWRKVICSNCGETVTFRGRIPTECPNCKEKMFNEFRDLSLKARGDAV